MIRPDFQKWNQTTEEMRRLSVEANHPRSRERYQALYMIGSGLSNASQWAKTIKRCKQTVLEWVHEYNTAGPEGLVYQHSGGRRPNLNEDEKKS
jgi:transposase